ncbi:MAG TPA: DUF4249 domain-containing protein [Flavipsychrobacter sp.]|nr:DUF4249 domain-containing protein [Flavipsychrobacter sp.]
MKQLFIAASATVLLGSCTSSLTTPIEVSKEKEQLVVNGFVAMINQTIPTAAVQVSVTQKLSQPGTPQMVTDAFVELNGTGFSYNPAESLYIPQTGINNASSFKMNITAGTIKASAEDVLPAFVPIVSATFTGVKKLISRYGGDTPTDYYEIKISFDDPSQAGDYYQLVMSVADSMQVASGFLFGSTEYDPDVVCNDVGVYEEQVIEQDPFENNANVFIPSNMVLMSDKYFNGQRKELTFYVSNYFLVGFPEFPDTSAPQPSEYVYMGLHHMSKKSFNHYKNVKLQQWNEGNPFAEPTIVPGNVSGALGFFGCRSISTTKLKTPL